MRFNLFNLLALYLLTIHVPALAEIYKSINPDGSVSYSDQPIKGGNPVVPPELTPVPAVKLPPKPEPVKEAKEELAKPYKAFSITSPAHNETIHNNNGDITITLDINPPLQQEFKHTVSISLDGKMVANKHNKASYTAHNVDRGSHSISASLHDKNGKILKSSSTVTIHLKRHSSLHKNQNKKH